MQRIEGIILLFLITVFIGCGENPKDKNTIREQTALETYTDKSLSGTEVEKQMDDALESESVILLVLVGKSEKDSDRAVQMAENAGKQIQNSVVIRMNRDDKAHAETVDTWQLSGIELPAVLVVSRKGIPVGGYTLTEASESKLIALIPSPKMDDAYVALNDGKPVFLVVSNSISTDRQMVLDICNNASVKLSEKAVIIEVDKQDKKELPLLKNFGIDPASNQTTTVVINSAGETTDTFNGIVSIAKLVESANKKGKSACCAPGEACAPKK